MKDVFKKYHDHRLCKHLGILGMSLVLALSINMLILDTPARDYLKANVLESSGAIGIAADMSVEYVGDSLIFTTNKNMSQVLEIAFSVTYDPDVTVLGDEKTTLKNTNISTISQAPGIATYLIQFSEAQDISSGTPLAEIISVKKQEKTSFVNLMNINFTDSTGEQYILSSSGTMF